MVLVIHSLLGFAARHSREFAVIHSQSRFVPGSIWQDDRGEHINAHGGGILYHANRYYWFGEYKSADSNNAYVGVTCYSSADLYNWKYESVALSVSADSTSEITAGCIIERPKVIYNPKTRKFVMYFHLELKGKGYTAARTGIAVSDRVTGKFEYIGSCRPNAGFFAENMIDEQKNSAVKPSDFSKNDADKRLAAIRDGLFLRRDLRDGQMSRDMTLFVDDDGQAYHIFASEENQTLHIAELSADFLHHTGRYVRVAPGGLNEAPAIFKKDGKYFMFASGCTGWNPNAARLFTADSIWGVWTEHPNPCVGADADLTFHAQSTFVLPVQGKPNAFIFMADRWKPKNPIDGRYVWLPVIFENGLPVLKWFDSWDLSVFDETQLQQQGIVTSPDGNYIFTFYQKQKTENITRLYYTVSYKKKMVIEESELGLQIENNLFENALGIPNDTIENWSDNLKWIGIQQKTVHQSWKPVYGERSEYADNYNELALKFEKGNVAGYVQSAPDNDGYDKRFLYFMNIIVRAYNEGVAFHYDFPEASNGLFLHITGERTQFAFPKNTLGYYEKWAQGPYAFMPIDRFPDECERPLALKLENGLTAAIGEAGLTDFARMKYKINRNEGAAVLCASLYDSVDVITPYATPWRWIMAAEKPTQLIENNCLVLNLNKPCEIQTVDWIKPGKAIRITRLNQADALKTVDFAAERGLQYVHLDAGWYGKEFLVESDASKVDSLKDLDIPALVKYAEGKGIGVFLYVNQRALSRQLDEILPRYKEWGIKGLKFGFVQTGNQYWTTWLHDAIRKCAEYGLLADIHDEYRPTGFSRTYPNLLTQEGIRGNEEFPDATHNTVLPFTRFLAGAGDYTICYFDSRLKNTHAHQLALSVIYFSPLQFLYWYDTPDRYGGEPETEFFNNVRTVWDDTKIIDGEIGEFIITARKSGDEWFVGAITNNDSREISIPLNFLEKGKKYTARIYTDDDSVQTKTNVAVSQKTVIQKDMLKFKLKGKGGVAIQLRTIN
jgi:alpha-glucosidase